MKTHVEKFRAYLEGLHIGPIQWIVSFSAIILVRFFLEAFTSPSPSGIIASDGPTLIHYALWFSALALAIMLFLWFWIPSWRKALPALVLMSYPIIWISPIIDFIASRGHGFSMGYIFQDGPGLIGSFLTFFGSPILSGITVGIRVEVMIALLGAILIFHASQQKWMRTIVGALGLYAIIFFFAALPSFVFLSAGPIPDMARQAEQTVLDSPTLMSNIVYGTLAYRTAQSQFDTGFDFMMGRILFITVCALIVLWFFLDRRDAFLATMRNSRGERVAHYWLMIGFGIYLASRISPPIAFGWNDAIAIAVLFAGIYAAWMFAVCTNDLNDVEIDAISNPQRPLVSRSMARTDMNSAAGIFLLISLIGGYLAGYYAFFAMLAFTAAYYAYSVPPLRLKRIPLISSFLISLACLSAAIAGFFTISSSKLMSAFPLGATIGIILVTFLWSHVRDLKDMAGDGAAGIRTVPVMLGLDQGKRFVGLLAAAAFPLGAIFIGKDLIILLSVIPAALTYHFAVREPYRELPLFIIYFASIAIAFGLAS